MLGIAAVVLLFLGAGGVLFWRAMHAETPTAQFVVETDHTLDGAIVTITSAEDQRVVASRPVMERNNRYFCRAVVTPGTYWVRVTHGDREVHRTNRVQIGEYQIGYLKLPLPRAGQPSSSSSDSRAPRPSPPASSPAAATTMPAGRAEDGR